MVIKFKENLEPGQETVILPDTVDLEEYDSDNVKASICYFIAGK